MSNETNVSKKYADNRISIRIFLTIVAYMLMAAVLLTVLPVVCPLIFGIHTYNVSSDTTGLASQKGSVVYTKNIGGADYIAGNIIAITKDDSQAVDVYYVDSNDSSSETLTLRNGVSENYNRAVGKVVAKTPFVGYLTQLCYSVTGVIIIAIIFTVGLALMIVSNSLAKRVDKKLENNTALSS